MNMCYHGVRMVFMNIFQSLQQLKLFEVQSTLNDLLPTEEGKSKECESLRRERESEQRICDQVIKLDLCVLSFRPISFSTCN